MCVCERLAVTGCIVELWMPKPVADEDKDSDVKVQAVRLPACRASEALNAVAIQSQLSGWLQERCTK